MPATASHLLIFLVMLVTFLCKWHLIQSCWKHHYLSLALWVTFASFFFESHLSFSSTHPLRTALKEVDSFAHSYWVAGSPELQAAHIPLERVAWFPIIMRKCTPQLPGFPLVFESWITWLPFKAAVSAPQPFQHVPVPSFLFLSFATISISLCHNFSFTLKCSMEDGTKK